MLLYLHIPFCDSKCHYCAFNSFTHNHYLKSAYMDALLQQLRFEIKRFNPDEISSVYIGGGTPSTVEARLYEPIFATLSPLLAENAEITVEANPNSAKSSWLQAMKELGANRISFGVQSFDERKLRLLGRAHTPKEAIDAIKKAYEAGFEHINIDLIYDTVVDTPYLLERDVALATSLPIDHMSAYALTLEEGTPFANTTHYKKSDENLGYLIKELIPFTQYEVSNFGFYRSRHNLGYWRLYDYIGVGSGAVGFLKQKRFYPSSDLHAYIQNPLFIREESLTKEDLRLERIFLGLRSCVGVEIEILDPTRLHILIEEGKLVQRDGRVYNPNYFIADELALYLS